MCACKFFEDRSVETLGLAYVRASHLDAICLELNIEAWVARGEVYMFIFREEDRNYLPTVLDRFAIAPDIDFSCEDADTLRWEFGCQ